MDMSQTYILALKYILTSCINIKTISGPLELQIHEIILVSIPLYRTLNSKPKYKCLHVYHQKEIKLSLPELLKILSILCFVKIQHAAYRIKL